VTGVLQFVAIKEKNRKEKKRKERKEWERKVLFS
jgi:hypothetical protein